MTEMDKLILDLIQFAPAVAVLLYLNVRQDRRNEKLVKALMACYRECEDRIGRSEGGSNEPEARHEP